MRTVMLYLALAAGWAHAQDAPAQNAPGKAVRDIRDVQIGMSRDHVLAGLSDQYECSRVVASEAEGFEAWSVSPKYDPERSVQREPASIMFLQGKTASIDILMYPSMTGESARFAERLFWLLYHKADPPGSPDYAQRLFDSRYVTLPVELRDVHHDEDEVLSIRFTLGGQEFSIMVQKQHGKPDRVDVVQRIVAPTNRK